MSVEGKILVQLLKAITVLEKEAEAHEKEFLNLDNPHDEWADGIHHAVDQIKEEIGIVKHKDGSYYFEI